MAESGRKLGKNGMDYEVTEDWVKNEIIKISKLVGGDKERKLVSTMAKDGYNREGTILFSLEGSPSRGYALYNKQSKKLCLIGWGFNGKKTYNDVIVI